MKATNRILVFIDWFDPGYNAGTTRSCTNFVQQMKQDYSIAVFTSDRDFNAREPYKNIFFNQWVPFDQDVKVYYCSPSGLTWKNIKQQIEQVKPDFIYLNSMFSKYFTLYPLLMAHRGLVNAKVVLAPKGMLKDSAIQFKKFKKQIYISFLRLTGVYKKVHFQASDITEVNDIKKWFGNDAVLSLVPDPFGKIAVYSGSIEKKAGQIAIIFIGRVHRIKNLDYLLSLLPAIKGKIQLTIVGSEEDVAYASECKNSARQFPDNISVSFTGGIPNHELPAIIAKHHIMALPTRGENFGHVIVESLAAGKPVLISDQTPWRNLAQAHAGWDIPLAQKEKFIEVLQKIVDFDQAEYDRWAKGAWQFIDNYVKQADLSDKYKKLFSR